ncbi:hypothetical protein SAMN05444716_107274 [Streptomyces harbinensis]|uniref:Uncharacterized protein n=1 Tax=Streptomyces harbinensis TaxID=1176198 RepID=A0A1I6VAK2_9ACTN|nr:hypothetical protein SAMN05444716_107274 [Streptomyces harbinensis]
MPLIRTGKSPNAVSSRSRSPTARFFRPAVSASTMISPGPLGGVPSRTSMERGSTADQALARVGAPVVGPMFSFAASTTTTSGEDTDPVTRSTPGTAATSPASAAGTVSGLPTADGRSKLPPRDRSAGPTITSEAVRANSLSNVVVIVAVNTSVPHTNATDSSTAIPDSAIRPLWAHRLRTEALSTAMPRPLPMLPVRWPADPNVRWSERPMCASQTRKPPLPRPPPPGRALRSPHLGAGRARPARRPGRRW